MIGLSRTTGYAIHALTSLARSSSPSLLLSEIAHDSGAPRPYLSKILRRLRDDGIVCSKRGHKGGIWLAIPPDRLSLLAVCESVEGPNFISECLLGPTFCSGERPCPTSEFWAQTRAAIREELARITLADVADCMVDSKEKNSDSSLDMSTTSS